MKRSMKNYFAMICVLVMSLQSAYIKAADALEAINTGLVLTMKGAAFGFAMCAAVGVPADDTADRAVSERFALEQEIQRHEETAESKRRMESLERRIRRYQAVSVWTGKAATGSFAIGCAALGCYGLVNGSVALLRAAGFS